MLQSHVTVADKDFSDSNRLYPNERYALNRIHYPHNFCTARLKKLSLQKLRDLKMKGSHKQTEAKLKRFDDHGCLSRSEESKCLWTHGNCTIFRSDGEIAHRHLRPPGGPGDLLSRVTYSDEPTFPYKAEVLFNWQAPSLSIGSRACSSDFLIETVILLFFFSNLKPRINF